MANDKKIKFAVIGCGNIGKKHAEVISGNTDAELIALCDSKEKSGLNIDKYNVAFFNSVQDMLNANLDIDVINIATPNAFHCEHALACLTAGKHVVVEKPMALKKRDAQQMINKAKEVNKNIFVVMQNRYSPPSVWIKELIEKKIPGKIFFVQVNCFWNRDERYYVPRSWHGTKSIDGGPLFTQFSHFIDLLFWVFGDIKNIRSVFFDFNHQKLTDFEDSGIVTFDFEKGGAGVINYSTSVYNKNFESSITILAEHGTIKIGGQYMNYIEYCDVKNYLPPQLAETNRSNNYGAYTGSAANHHFVIENVIDVLKNKAAITTHVYEGMKVVEIIENMYSGGKRPQKKQYV